MFACLAALSLITNVLAITPPTLMTTRNVGMTFNFTTTSAAVCQNACVVAGFSYAAVRNDLQYCTCGNQYEYTGIVQYSKYYTTTAATGYTYYYVQTNGSTTYGKQCTSGSTSYAYTCTNPTAYVPVVLANNFVYVSAYTTASACMKSCPNMYYGLGSKGGCYCGISLYKSVMYTAPVSSSLWTVTAYLGPVVAF